MASRNVILVFGFVLGYYGIGFSQNLPSLLLEKNINATFSIIAYDADQEEWGIAVATNNIYVGNSTVHIEPGVGAFSIIAETEPMYAVKGFEHLNAGESIEKAISSTRQTDGAAHYRQVAGIDKLGNTFAFTGEALKYWKGYAKHMIGEHYVVLGNQLHEAVLPEMAKTFESAKGTLAERLLESLLAGQKAGGQITGKQSAALVVKGTRNEWFNQIDLRVDHSKTPFEDLKRLLNYHYGRIRLNQALYAQREGNTTLAERRLVAAEGMLEGWTGMYPKIAIANLSIRNEEVAVHWIQKGLNENSNFKAYLPSFYVLKDHPALKGLIQEETFDIRDWESALSMLSNLGKELELISLAKRLIAQDMDSSQVYFLLGRAYYFEKENAQSIQYLTKAVALDKENIEAVALLEKIKG
ncbi:MAG: DUF1028 domain-containing protein [Bacteroidota bacterium]